MTIVYRLGGALYLNITNKCPCNCRFCIRNNAEGINPGESLWLEREPEPEEVINALAGEDIQEYSEIVFCGYGEPTERLSLLLDTARYLKEQKYSPIRLNTNGLSDLINGKKTAPLLAKYIDSISISLNAPDAASYYALCAPVFGEGAFDAMIQFAKECRELIPEVKLSIVDINMDEETVKACRKLAASLDIPLRLR